MRTLSAMRKEFQEIAHDRTLLAIIIAFPIFVMLFMGSSFGAMEIRGLPIGVVAKEDSAFASAMLEGLASSKAFNLQSFGTESQALEAFRNGALKAVIIIPEGFDQSLAQGSGARIRIAVDNSDIALEQSILAAMSSVVEASSRDITRAYISSAWEDLRKLNGSASALGRDISESRARMEEAKEDLTLIREAVADLDMEGLDGSLLEAQEEASALGVLLQEQRDQAIGSAMENEALLNSTEAFLHNASMTLDESLQALEDTHGRLRTQKEELNGTRIALQASIAGLETIKAGTSDPVAAAALDLNIAGLGALDSAMAGQLQETEDQIEEIEGINATLQEFRTSLDEYQLIVIQAKADGYMSGGMLDALDEAQERLEGMEEAFGQAGGQITKLKSLLGDVERTSQEMDSTLDEVLAQTGDVDALIMSLGQTVAQQTGKDPERIAAPLEVTVEAQYQRSSFVDFMMPQVIAVSLLFTCFLLSSISLVREKSGRTIIRALMVGGGLSSLVMGKMLALLLISLGQVLLILLVGTMLFAVQAPQDPLLLLLGGGISALVLISIGMLIGFLARSESAAIQSSLIIAIPMLFLGNIIFSPDLLPTYTQSLQELLPLAHITNIFKIVLITGGDPSADMVALGTYFVALAALIGIMVLKRRDMSAYS